ncbi:hypothetical protein XIS1_470002 [Xenorhabdus innexi]|uniref:Uncharacterized protein n=1 Tax=Xenorhabdus innexi TaxID=290109 RepID=A0A1N6MY95_9GAMM|nr:hypothetical protein XIS1_470002 [Xenorhabdus innexi]
MSKLFYIEIFPTQSSHHDLITSLFIPPTYIPPHILRLVIYIVPSLFSAFILSCYILYYYHG